MYIYIYIYFTQLTPVLGSPRSVVSMKMKQGEKVIWLLLKIDVSTAISMKRFRRELSTDTVVYS